MAVSIQLQSQLKMARLLTETGIKYEDLSYGALNGFATVGANNGHNGTGGKAFLDHPQTVIDYAYRS